MFQAWFDVWKYSLVQIVAGSTDVTSIQVRIDQPFNAVPNLGRQLGSSRQQPVVVCGRGAKVRCLKFSLTFKVLTSFQSITNGKATEHESEAHVVGVQDPIVGRNWRWKMLKVSARFANIYQRKRQHSRIPPKLTFSLACSGNSSGNDSKARPMSMSNLPLGGTSMAFSTRTEPSSLML